MTKPCTCTKPGNCPRHSIEKTEHWWKLCQTHEGYRKLWDDFEGPGQLSLPKEDRGLGDTITRTLGKAGEQFKRTYRTYTRRGCGCNRRAHRLNKATERIYNMVRRGKRALLQSMRRR